MRGPYTRAISVPLKQERVEWYRTDFGALRTPLPYRLSRGIMYPSPPASFLISQVGQVAVSTIENAALSTMDLTPAYNRAVAKWYGKARSSIQLGVDYAERRELLKLLESSLKALRDPFGTLARQAERFSSKKKLKKLPEDLLLRDLPGAYLTFHFGIEPVYKTIFEAFEEFEKVRKKKRLIVAETHVERNWDSPSTGWYKRWTNQRKGVVRVSAELSLVNDTIATLDMYGLANPAEIAWELVPFSFVVDWFYPINLYLTAMLGVPGHQIKNGYRTDFWQTHHQFTLNGGSYTPAFKNYEGQIVRGESVYLKRSLLTFIYPETQRSLNPWKTSVTRALTSISLLAQLLYKQRNGK